MKIRFSQNVVFALGFIASYFVFIYGVFPVLSQEKQVERRSSFPTETVVEFGTPWTGSGVEGPRRDMEKAQFDETASEREKYGEVDLEFGDEDYIHSLKYTLEQKAAYEADQRRVDRQLNWISYFEVHEQAQNRVIDALANVEEIIEEAEENMEAVSCFIKRLHDNTAVVKAPPLNYSYNCD